MSPSLMRALLAAAWDEAERLLGARIPGEWRGVDWRWLGKRPGQAEADPAVMPWLPRVMLLRKNNSSMGREAIVVGEAGFNGPPDRDGWVEIGYMVVAEYRRSGYAEEAVRALMTWASAEHGITRFRASISPQNIPSLNLIRKLSFVHVGPHRHERRSGS